MRLLALSPIRPGRAGDEFVYAPAEPREVVPVPPEVGLYHPLYSLYDIQFLRILRQF